MTISKQRGPEPVTDGAGPGDSGGRVGKRTLTSALPASADAVADRVLERLLRRASDGESPGTAGADVASARGDATLGATPGIDATAPEAAVARAAGSSGHALPVQLQRQFEASTGADLSGVRVHTGQASQLAAFAVHAQAYTVGQDIHFAAGRYQPDDARGVHLLAHEVAHTVQQAGGDVRRQHRLEVSGPDDPCEREADRAADAMVAGRPAELGGAPVGPQRAAEASPDAANRAWAQGQRPAVRQLVDDVAAARARHTADARAALEAVTRAQASYERYEKKFGVALVAFKRGVAAAQKAEQELRDAASVIANFALARGLPELDAASKHVSTVLGWVAKAATVATAAGVAPAKAAPGPVAPTPSGGPPSSTDIGVGGRVDWKALLETTHGAFRGYVEGSATLDALGAAAASSERFLSEVAEGGHASDDAATLPAGVVASALAAAGPAIAARLAAVSGTDVSGPAARFADGAAVALDGLSVQRIEQDIAITWIASLTEAQRDEIDTADTYLKSIGVIDAKHNRLGYDTGAVTLDTDERLIHVRAQVEQMAMAAVGTGEWMGRTGGVGYVRDRNGTQWPAELTQPMPERAGGAVLLTGFRWNAPTSAEGDWWKSPGTDAALRTALIGHCVFAFQPLGPAGGGADDGPAVEPGRGDPATAPTNPAWH